MSKRVNSKSDFASWTVDDFRSENQLAIKGAEKRFGPHKERIKRDDKKG